MNDEQILMVKNIAVVLKLAEKTVYSMAQGGELLAFKIRGQGRVRKADFDPELAPKNGAKGNASEPRHPSEAATP